MLHLVSKPTSALSDSELGEACSFLNTEYRKGNELVSDDQFELIWMASLKTRVPEHPLLNGFQPSSFAEGTKIKHKIPMLSTDKAYTIEDIEKFVDSCEKSAIKIGIKPDSLLFRISPKFDGISGNYTPNSQTLTTRGEDGFGDDYGQLIKHGITNKTVK